MSITTSITWPASLPKPLREGHSTQHQSPTRRTNLASGRARVRRVHESVPSLKRFEWLMTGLQAAAFEAWFRDVLQDGTQWFKLSTRTPMGLQTEMVCRFVDMYDGPNLEAVNHWRIRAELEVWERPLMPAGWGHAIDFLVRPDYLEQAVNREWPEA